MWNVLGTVPPSELLDARLEAHHAAQWIARATRAYCQPESDDSHTSMSWDSSAQALMGRPLTDDLTLGLRLENLTLLARSGRGDEYFSLIGQTEVSVDECLRDLIRYHNLDYQKLKEPGPYTLPAHRLDSGGAYGAADAKGREEFAKYYSNVTPFLEVVREAYLQASPVRCWPHFFDIATLLTFEQPGSSSSKKATIGVGLSPGDATFSEPYVYVSLWPYPPAENLPSLIPPAFWQVEGFTAVILRSGDLISEKSPERQETKVKAIIEQGVQESVELLTP